jgi:hypothetical protein
MYPVYFVQRGNGEDLTGFEQKLIKREVAKTGTVVSGK